MEEIDTTLQQMHTKTASAYDTIDEMGGDIPPQRNMANMPDAIRSIPTGPSLHGLQKALQNGTAQDEYPIGTEIPDIWNETKNPVIVAQYLNFMNNSSYDGANGVVLVRKYLDPSQQVFGSTSDYTTSSAKAFLDGDYLDKCSAAMKAAISEINIPYYNGSIIMVKSKWFLLSGIEVGAPYQSGEGVFFDYWKKKTGLTSASAAANTGRSLVDVKNSAQVWWLRSRYNGTNGEYYVAVDGSVTWATTSNYPAIMPACFIAGPAPTSLAELKEFIDQGKYVPVGTEIPDTYNGTSNPLIVVKSLDGTDSAYQNADGTNVKGVILQRKYITDVGQKWDDGPTNSNYGASTIDTFLNDTYLSRCSSEIQGMVSECKIPVVISSGATKVQCKWFLASIEEVYGQASGSGTPGIGTEGSYFPYWKAKTGLSSPSRSINDGRVVNTNNASGDASPWWLRSMYPIYTDMVWAVGINGSIVSSNNVASTSYGVLPCCIIAQGQTSIQSTTLESRTPLVITPEYIPSVEEVKVEIKPKVKTIEKEV